MMAAVMVPAHNNLSNFQGLRYYYGISYNKFQTPGACHAWKKMRIFFPRLPSEVIHSTFPLCSEPSGGPGAPAVLDTPSGHQASVSRTTPLRRRTVLPQPAIFRRGIPTVYHERAARDNDH